MDAPHESAHAGAVGLRAALLRCQAMPDPPGLEHVAGNNKSRLREVAKLCYALAGGRAGSGFFLGGGSLGKLFDVPPKSAIRWLKQLEKLGIIRMTWRGRKCRVDKDGNEYAGGTFINRASEYEFLGLPAVASCNQKK